MKTKIILSIGILFYVKSASAQFVGSNPIQQGSSGNVAIGYPAYTPAALLQVKNGAILADGTTGAIPATGAGTRMMWYPQKAAFRAGVASATSWDDVNIGSQSFACGSNSIASGTLSFAAGSGTTASNTRSFAIGFNTTCSGLSA